ncbi:MAG: hypothetical protein RUMPE_00899 [Eubacteriales bacterium SKADARSKE-1]|nr:hypothetical protein [Eubacteriales bacterium SKADARSKE-1]
MKKILTCISLIIVLVNIVGCTNNIPSQVEKKTKYPEVKTQDSIILFDEFSKKMFSYNTKTFSIEEKCNIDNFMQYKFPTECNYYTAGNSNTFGFEIIKIENNKIKILLQVNEDEAIFPVAKSNNILLFLKSKYENNECINNVLVSYDEKENKLVEYSNVKLAICNGAIIKDKLFFTVYIKEGTYDLYKV